MCRSFGRPRAEARVKATFWLLDAPDSLQAQSHRNVDGAGLRLLRPDGRTRARQAARAGIQRPGVHPRSQAGRVLVLRGACPVGDGRGGRRLNTHPFVMDGRVMAHNGGFGELAQLDTELGSYARLVLGDTDSERYFALITKETDAHGGDVGAAIICNFRECRGAPAPDILRMPPGLRMPLELLSRATGLG